MNADRRDIVAKELAHNRSAGIVSDLPLTDIGDVAEAYAIQSAATADFADDDVGYTVVGSSAGARRSLGLDAPIFGTIAQGSVIREEQPGFRIPAGLIGAQCELVFTIGNLPMEDMAADREALAGALLGCRAGIGLLGRRTSAPLSPLGAIADHALHVATICGRYREGGPECDLNAIEVRAHLDGNEVAHGVANAVMGGPVNVVMWLADQLRNGGGALNPGDIVATGSLTPILQVLPGQRLEVDFGPIGRVACDFE